MSIYTVYEPPLKAHESAPAPERFVFVRDGFSFWAFLLAPLWMLRHRLLLAFTGYVIVAIGLQVALRLVGASTGVTVTVAALLFFFFSSRRRHTRWTGDWSSDVCSSDLTGPDIAAERHGDPVGEVPV